MMQVMSGRQEKGQALATFAKSIRVADRAFANDPGGTPLVPNWNRVQSVLPNLLEELREAVPLDNA